jgi:molecular chaperone GrpE
VADQNSDPEIDSDALAGAELSPEAELDQLRGEIQEANNRLLRAQAELDNYRKRARREIEEERRYAELPLLRDLLPVVDNISRAVEAAEKNHDPAGLLEGFRMVGKLLEGVLERHDCRQMDALGQPFDPNLHQAIAQQPSADQPENTVIAVGQHGYRLHDRVVRPAQVVVSTRPADGKG